MVGIVIVSHSAKLAEGVAELAREMGGAEIALERAGGVDGAEGALGTDAALVLEALERAYSDDGVLVLMDLGSAVLSAEMAVDMLPPERRERVLLCEAPLVEGAVAAAVAARLGRPLEEVAGEARSGLAGKAAHLGAPETAAAPPPGEASGADARALRLSVRNALGLHARPAARFVQTAAEFDCEVSVTNASTGAGPASGRSLNSLATLGVRQGHEILVRARGRQAPDALAALAQLAEQGFGEAEETVMPPRPRVSSPAAATSPAGPLKGLAASPGIAFGAARRFQTVVAEVPIEPAVDPQAEWEELRQALERVRREIEETRRSVGARAGDYHAAIFDAHLLFLDDEALLDPARAAILGQGRNAADAWNAAVEQVAAAYRRLDDEYLRARADDVAAVGRRVLAHLSAEAAERPSLEGPGILVAPDLSPAETAGLDPGLVRGIATGYGGPTSHSAILARALGLPAVVGLGEAVLAVAPGAELVLDGNAGVVYVDPPPELVDRYRALTEERATADRAARAVAHDPAVTADGRRIEVAANVGSLEEVAAALAAGADGVGLLRTEFLFLERSSLPDEDEQYAAYRAIAEALGGRPLIVRTLDVGGDKPLPYLPRPVEANPFLGVRGVRLALAHPDLFVTQLRAILRVAAEFPVKVMFPMIAAVEEYRATRSLLEDAKEDLARADVRVPEAIETGIMVEVPAAALTARAFASEVDFFSVGTNDLAQYTMAAERGNDMVGALADALHPAVLGLIDRVVDAADAAGKWVGVCGEVAADPLAVPLLVGLGVRELSMSPAGIPHAKALVRATDSDAARRLSEEAVAAESAAAVRALVAREAGGADARSQTEALA